MYYILLSNIREYVYNEKSFFVKSDTSYKYLCDDYIYRTDHVCELEQPSIEYILCKR